LISANPPGRRVLLLLIDSKKGDRGRISLKKPYPIFNETFAKTSAR
jgi:hypothetical protein